LGTPRAIGISFGAWKLTTHLRLVPRSKNGWTCASTHPIRLRRLVLGWGSTGTTLPLPLIRTYPV